MAEIVAHFLLLMDLGLQGKNDLKISANLWDMRKRVPYFFKV